MDHYSDIAASLRLRLAALNERSGEIEDDLRQPLDADFAEQAIDLADDEALEGVDTVLRAEAHQIRLALARIDNGTYGTCTNCGETISPGALKPVRSPRLASNAPPRWPDKKKGDPVRPPFPLRSEDRSACKQAYFLRLSPPKRLLNAATRPPSLTC